MTNASLANVTTSEYAADDPELATFMVPLREVLRLLGELNAKRDDEIDALRRLVAVQEATIARLDDAIDGYVADDAPSALH